MACLYSFRLVNYNLVLINNLVLHIVKVLLDEDGFAGKVLALSCCHVVLGLGLGLGFAEFKT